MINVFNNYCFNLIVGYKNMNYLVLLITFIGVNLDFFFMLLFLLKKYRLFNVIVGYLLANLFLLIISFLIGIFLKSILPIWLLGILGVIPIYIAFHDDDNDHINNNHSEIISTFITYLSTCSSCNLAIFTPVLTTEKVSTFLATLIYISFLIIIVVLLGKLIINNKLVKHIMDKYGEVLMRICYIVIGIYVFFDSGLIAHLLALI